MKIELRQTFEQKSKENTGKQSIENLVKVKRSNLIVRKLKVQI